MKIKIAKFFKPEMKEISFEQIEKEIEELKNNEKISEFSIFYPDEFNVYKSEGKIILRYMHKNQDVTNMTSKEITNIILHTL